MVNIKYDLCQAQTSVAKFRKTLTTSGEMYVLKFLFLKSFVTFLLTFQSQQWEFWSPEWKLGVWPTTHYTASLEGQLQKCHYKNTYCITGLSTGPNKNYDNFRVYISFDTENAQKHRNTGSQLKDESRMLQQSKGEYLVLQQSMTVVFKVALK